MTRLRGGQLKDQGSNSARCKGCGVLSGRGIQSRNYFTVLLTYLLLLFIDDLMTPFTWYRMTVENVLEVDFA